MAKAQGLKRVFFHAFLDGRDTPPRSALGYITQLEDHCAKIGVGRIATVSGYYAMDRDRRWERVQKAYEIMVLSEGIRKLSAAEAVRQSYENNKSDEFMLPTVILGPRTNRPVAALHSGDAVIFCNFRSDRAREITRALTDPDFDGFKRSLFPRLNPFVCLTTYDETFDLPVAFPPVRLKNILGEVVSGRGVRQLRIAETEKYAHVTFFSTAARSLPLRWKTACSSPLPVTWPPTIKNRR